MDQFSGAPSSQYVRLRYLCGTDDSGPWAVRVASTIDTLDDALESLVPVVVKRALAKGKRVLRQGDIYAYEVSERYDTTEPMRIMGSHIWNPTTRILTHDNTWTGLRGISSSRPPHAPLHVPFPCRFEHQTATISSWHLLRHKGTAKQ